MFEGFVEVPFARAFEPAHREPPQVVSSPVSQFITNAYRPAMYPQAFIYVLDKWRESDSRLAAGMERRQGFHRVIGHIKLCERRIEFWINGDDLTTSPVMFLKRCDSCGHLPSRVAVPVPSAGVSRSARTTVPRSRSSNSAMAFSENVFNAVILTIGARYIYCCCSSSKKVLARHTGRSRDQCSYRRPRKDPRQIYALGISWWRVTAICARSHQRLIGETSLVPRIDTRAISTGPK